MCIVALVREIIMSEDDEVLQIGVNPISVAQALERMVIIKPKLAELQELFKEFRKLELDLKLVANKDHSVTQISKQKYLLDVKESEMGELQALFYSLDCVIKDWNSGLIDFISYRQGKPVWLCFKEGEDELIYYHEWNAGFVGRQLIDFE